MKKELLKLSILYSLLILHCSVSAQITVPVLEGRSPVNGIAIYNNERVLITPVDTARMDRVLFRDLDLALEQTVVADSLKAVKLKKKDEQLAEKDTAIAALQSMVTVAEKVIGEADTEIQLQKKHKRKWIGVGIGATALLVVENWLLFVVR